EKGPGPHSSWREGAEPIQARMAVSLTAAKTLDLQGTQDQENVMMMEPKEEEQTWECETRLHGNHSPSQEVFCQRFKQLCYQETPGPWEALSQLRVLCCERLRSESHTKEQILELLVLEQFLTILLKELQSWVQGHHPKSGEKAVTVLEDLEKGLNEPGPQVERGTSLGAAWEKPSFQLQVYLQFPSNIAEDDAETKDKGSLPQPPITEVEPQVLREKLTTSTTTFEAAFEGEGPLEQQQRNLKRERLRESPTQGKSFRHMVIFCLTHKTTPTGKKDRECSECGKAFICNSHLIIHQKIHSGKKTCKYSDCGKMFNQSSNLIQQQRIHTGERKPYKCYACGKSFRWSAPLFQHQRIHLGKKPYNCNECGKASSQSFYLSQPLRIHKGEKPLICKECGKAYRWSSRHQRVHAREEPSPWTEGEKLSRQSCTFV
uniref:Zinc finger protein 232 n=1 Tax=Moschus moschiferus TaxID=68415 RepID=A0A8C6D767_MOSMO